MKEQPESLAQQIFNTKWIANGFPKSGTHLLTMLINPLAPLEGPTSAGYFDQPWAGTFKDNSWTNERQKLERTTFHIGRIGNGHMIKAHLGYDPELARFIYLTGAIHVMIYRDLRDVAVSQAHHILNCDNERLAHPAPELYDREDFDKLLLQVINGHERFPTLVQRWEQYAPWLDDDWAFCIKYEDLLADTRRWARQIFTAAMVFTGRRFNVSITLDKHGTDVLVDTMVRVASNREKSPTFRKGQPGNWREVFKPQHVEALKATGGDKWLIELGYEDSEDWYE